MGRRLSDQVLRRIGRTLSALGISFVPITVILLARADALDQMFTNFTFADSVIALCYGTLGLVLITSEPRNRLVWLFVVVGFIPGVTGMIGASAELLAQSQGVTYAEIDLSAWPPGVATLVSHLHALWVVANFGLPTLGLLLVPDGRLLSRRWLPVAVTATAAIAVLWLAFAAKWPLLSEDAIASYTGWRFTAVTVVFGIVALSVVASYASLVVRYRQADTETKRRLRWVLAGSALFVLTFFPAVVGPEALLLVFYPILALSFGLAIWRDQLFDIDAVISRTLVYVSSLAVIGGIYVAVVFGVGSLIGQRDGSPVLPVIATALIAILFHPARVRLERLANRLVFGRRATPYEVLSEFTQRVAATDEQLLADVARSVADGTVAKRASVWSLGDGMLEPISTWPEDRLPAATAAIHGNNDELTVPGADETYPIVHDGRTIGALGLNLPTSESLPPGDRALIDELTAGIGLALWNRELTEELRSSINDLQASRRRLVALQDETRHRLERDLHDGAQQRLVAIKVRLSIARQMAEQADAPSSATTLATLCDDTDNAIESLRDFARGVYPPLLQAEGLRAALEAQLGRSRLPIELSCTVGRRHRRELEATIYFSVLETLGGIERAMTNDRVRVSVVDDNGRLTFEISGPTGIDLPHHVEDRIDALGGKISLAGDQTVLSGWLPVIETEKVARV